MDHDGQDRARAELVVKLMNRLGPIGWGTIDQVLHAAALQALPLRTLEMLDTLVLDIRRDETAAEIDKRLAARDGITRIAGERARQVAKGFDAKHDDAHGNGELREAAAYYMRIIGADWPWKVGMEPSPSRSDEVRSLEKAGALIAAELDRVVRTARRGAV